MWEELKQIKATQKQPRNFGLFICGLLILIAAYQFFFGNPALAYLFGVSIVLALVAIFMPQPLKPIYILWMMLAVIIGWIMSRVILTIVFYLILTPVGLVARVFGRRFLPPGPDQSTTSYWQRRPAQADPRTCEKQY